VGEPDKPPGFLRRAGYSLLTLLIFAGLLEAGLAVFRVGDPHARLSLTRGFSNAARYIVPEPGKPGWLRTQMYGGESPEIEIPPNDGRIRVVMLGGSNVEGFPTEWLEDTLTSAAPDPGFEVVNLGRRGYGTERDRILLRQALALKPDIVLLYEGHNEFVEAGFAVELQQAAPAPWVAGTVESLAGLRTMNAALSLAESLQPAVAPEAEQHRGVTLTSQTPDQAAAFYTLFHDNVASMTDLARGAGVRVLLATVVWNDFEPPFATALAAGTSADTEHEVARLRGQALELVPPRFRPGIVQTTAEEPALHLQPTDWGDALPPETAAARRAANSGLVAPPMRSLQGLFGGKPLIAPLDTVSDGVPKVLASYAEIVQRHLSRKEREDLVQAGQIFDQVLALAPDHPVTLFDRGLVAYLLGLDADAARWLRAASAADRAPVHANDPIDDAMRAVGSEHAGDAGVRFVDVEQAVRATMPQGLVGYEIMQDGCHLHRMARRKLLTLMVPTLLELGKQISAGR
jgi:hypothetical protein